MSERDGYQHGVPCWVAAVEPDPSEAVGFYTELFGWEANDLMPPESPGRYFTCKLRGRDVAAVVSEAGGPPLPNGVWATHVWVDNADQVADSARAAGGSVILGPFESPARYRLYVIADPAGTVFSILESRDHRGARVVNEAGSVGDELAQHAGSVGCRALLWHRLRLGHGGVRGRDDVAPARLCRGRADAARAA